MDSIHLFNIDLLLRCCVSIFVDTMSLISDIRSFHTSKVSLVLTPSDMQGPTVM